MRVRRRRTLTRKCERRRRSPLSTAVAAPTPLVQRTKDWVDVAESNDERFSGRRLVFRVDIALHLPDDAVPTTPSAAARWTGLEPQGVYTSRCEWSRTIATLH